MVAPGSFEALLLDRVVVIDAVRSSKVIESGEDLRWKGSRASSCGPLEQITSFFARQ